MGLFNRLKRLMTPQERTSTDRNIYEDLGIVRPFTALENGQMREFVGELSNNKSLKEDEKKAFESLWYAICPDMDGFGNNIWNLKEGHFTIYEKEGIKAEYEKISSKDIDDDEYTDEGRVTFTFKSTEGDIVVHQNERNKRIFLAYVSEDISERLFSIFRDVETKILKLKRENQLSKYKFEVDENVSRNNQLEVEAEQIEEKDKGER